MVGVWGLGRGDSVMRVSAFGIRVEREVYLNPRSMQNDSPKPRITAIRAIILHTFGVWVGPVELRTFGCRRQGLAYHFGLLDPKIPY